MDGLRVLDALTRTLDDGAPLVTPPLCVATRYRSSSCRRCLDICPAAAITTTPWLRVDDGRCLKCGACAAVCRTGALDLTPLRAALRRSFSEAGRTGGEIMIVCRRAALPEDEAEPRVVVPCLAALAAGDLAAAQRLGLCALSLVHGDCAACELGGAASRGLADLRATAAALTAAGAVLTLTEDGVPSAAGESEPRAVALSRRGLFAALAGGVGAALGEPGTDVPLNIAELHAQYAPPRAFSALLADLAEIAAPGAGPLTPDLPPAAVRIGGRCDGCGLCVRYCPHAAIEITAGRVVVEAQRCTACALCAEVCPREVVTLEPAVAASV